MTNKDNTRSAVTMGFGVVVFVATLAAWLYGEAHHVDTTIVWTVAGPIILALFVGHQLGTTSDAAKQAASQTNGVLDARVKAAVAAALADRDAARTRQAQGDIGTVLTTLPATLEITTEDDVSPA
jgi:hypothetical protein